MAAPGSAQPPFSSDAARRRRRKRRRSPAPPRAHWGPHDEAWARGAEPGWGGPPAEDGGAEPRSPSPHLPTTPSLFSLPLLEGPRAPLQGSDWWDDPPRDGSWDGAPRDGPWGSPPRDDSWGSPPRDDSWGSPRRDDSWGSPRRDDSWGSPRRDDSWVSPRRDDSWVSPPRDDSWGRPTSPQRPPGNRVRKRKTQWGSPHREPPKGWAQPHPLSGPCPVDLRGGRWSSPKRQGSKPRQQAPARRQTEPGSPEEMRQEGSNGHPRGWGDPEWEPREECLQSWNHPGREQFQGDPARGRWNSPERRGREQQLSPRRRQVGSGSPERPPRRQLGPNSDPRGWDDPEREPRQKCPQSRSRPLREQFRGDPSGGGGRWSSPEGRGRAHRSPARGERGWGSPTRSRRQESPLGEQRSWGSPKQGEGQECSGSFGSQSQLDSEQDRVNRGGRRQSGFEQRGAGAQFPSSAESPKSSNRQQSSSGGQQGWSRPAVFQGGWNLDEGQAETESLGRGGKEEEGSDGEGGSRRRSASPTEMATSGPTASLRSWTPRKQVARYWMQCQAILKNRMRKQLLSVCPRPTLPDRSSETPFLNTDITCLLNAKQIEELGTMSRTLWVLQDEALDMLAPAMTIYEMAEEAMEEEEAVDPIKLREWARLLIRYIGSINQRLTVQRRVQVLGTINPRLKRVTSKMTSQCTNGKLFAEDKVELLKEIINRFPQLTANKEVFPGKYQPFSKQAQNVAAYRQRRFLLGPRSRPWDSATQPHGQSPAGQRVNQDHY